MLDDAFKEEYSVELLKIPEVPGTQLKLLSINTVHTANRQVFQTYVDKLLNGITMYQLLAPSALHSCELH